MSAAVASQGNGVAQYPAIKRKRPQQKKVKEPEKATKSNPSQRHRNRLNFEIDNIAQLIPFSKTVIDKLDKLSILRLAVSYLRNKSFHTEEKSDWDPASGPGWFAPLNEQIHDTCISEPESKLTLDALNGFLLVITQNFDVLFVSETIQKFLGYPQSDVMNQSILDLVHAEDRDIFMRHMQINPSQTPASPCEGDSPTIPEYTNLGLSPDMFKGFSQDGLFHRSFICRLRCLLDNSSGFVALHFTGHLRLVPGQNKKGDDNVQLPPEVGLFLLASPLQSPSILEIRTKNLIFRTKHCLDYTPLGIDAKGKIVLGYTEQQLRQRSGYEFIHSADMMHCADAHTKLMRKGESGLTVFRLLHKDNRWVWVTASARLVFREGRPDCIIATQRPILDQEGEEHMKKRTNAFRFDFTGQAILYGEVNPIGTRGGPENNPLTENLQGEPLPKRQRTAQPANDVDRKSLYGAQAMQRMDIYVGNIPHQPTNVYAKDEIIDNNIGPLSNDSNTTFYPFGTDIPAAQPTVQENVAVNYHAVSNGSNGYPANNFSSLPPGNYSVENPVTTVPTLHHQMSVNSNSSGEYNSPHIPQSQYSGIYNPTAQNSSVPMTNVLLKSNPLKRPFPVNTNTNGVPQGSSQRLPSTGKAMPPTNHIASFETNKAVEASQYTRYDQNIVNNRNHQKAVSQMQFYKPDPNREEPSTVVHQRPDQQFSSYVQSQQQNFLQPYGPQRSVTDSLTINSYVNIGQEPSAHEANRYQNISDADSSLPIPNQYDEPQLVGCQDNTIQFDLQKVATDYQTTDPLSKVQEYLQDNPSHAMAIATGLLPEAGMPQLASNQVAAYMLDYQFQPHVQHHNNVSNQPRMMSTSGSGSMNGSCPSMGQPCSTSDDDSSRLTLSVSSIDSYPSSNNQNLERTLGDFIPQEGFLQS